MNFTQAVRTVFSKYAVFTGRASRAEYWWFALFQAIVGLVLTLVFGLYNQNDPGALQYVGYTVYGLYGLATLLPSIGVSVRRLHDTGRGGGWIFISLVPLIGGIWFIVLTVLPGEPGSNRFGSAPDR